MRSKLKIYQWNADVIPPKLLELHNRLINSDNDVLAKTNKTSFIEGYGTIRKDRNSILGSGLLPFIRTDIVFEKLYSLEKADMKILSIRLKTNKSTWIELYNVFLLNTSTQRNSFDPSLINPGPSLLILSDLNGYVQMSDSFQPQDQRDNEILHWIPDYDLHIFKDGSATRTS